MRDDCLTVHVPMTFQRRGGRKLIVAPDGSPMPATSPRFNVDNVLVKALARGFRWRKLLDNGTYNTIKELAAKERNDPSYVADVLRLTLLAPDLVEMILDGRQPPGWQLHRLRKSFPIEWKAQREALCRIISVDKRCFRTVDGARNGKTGVGRQSSAAPFCVRKRYAQLEFDMPNVFCVHDSF